MGNSKELTFKDLCEEKGVCQSYAYAFDVLADLSGLESIMVTGTFDSWVIAKFLKRKEAILCLRKIY